jgi:hypothetical protein
MSDPAIKRTAVPRESAEAKDRSIRLLRKGVNLAERTITIVGSTIQIDRDGEIILPSAYETDLKRFLGSNAPFLAAHTHRTQDASPSQVGWVMAGTIRDNEVEFQVRFAQTENAEQWWLLASDPKGRGIAASVGFMPLEWVQGTAAELAKAIPELASVFLIAKIAGDRALRVYTQVELYELSGCPVPSNREALQVLAAKMAGGEEVLKALVMDAVKAALQDPQSIFAKCLEEMAFSKEITALEGRLKVLVTDLCDELKSLVPDHVNPPASSSKAPENEDDWDDAGTEDPGAEDAVREAATGLLDALRGKHKG